MSERQKDNNTKTGEPKTAAKKGKKKVTNIDRITEINKRALRAGMSYGKYVAKYGDEIETED